MKKAIVLMIWILLFGINLPAEAGDFIVEGRLGIGTTTPPGAKLDVLSTDAVGLNITATKTGPGSLSGSKVIAIDTSSSGSLSGVEIDYNHNGSAITNHVAAITNMTLSGSGTTTGDWGKVGHAYSLFFRGSAGTGYNYTSPNAYAFALRAAVVTNNTRTHYIRNIGGLQILHLYDNSYRTLSAENLYGIIVGDISQYSSYGLNQVANAAEFR